MVLKDSREMVISIEDVLLQGTLSLPKEAKGLVLFAHGSGSSRFSPRNRFVAQTLHDKGIATLLLDLLTEEEEAIDAQTGHLRFNILLLAARLISVTEWLSQQEEAMGLGIGYFGASTGAAAALVAAAADEAGRVKAVVSRGGRPDLSGQALQKVTAPTLLIVGGDDTEVLEMNRKAYALLSCKKRLEIVPGATHLFEEPGTLEEVARLAGLWFTQYL